MKLYISERFLTFKDKAAVTDENGAVRYYVHGDFAIVKKYYVDEVNGTQLASVVQKKISSTGTCVVSRNGNDIAEIVPKITLFKPKYEVKRLGWTIEGNFNQDKYSIKQNGKAIVNVNVRLLMKGNAYEIDITDGIDEVNALAVVLVIEGIFENTVLGTAVNSSVQSSFLS